MPQSWCFQTTPSRCPTSTGKGNWLFLPMERDRASVPTCLQAPDFCASNQQPRNDESHHLSPGPDSPHWSLNLEVTRHMFCLWGFLMWTCLPPDETPSSQLLCLQCWIPRPWHWTPSLFHGRICSLSAPHQDSDKTPSVQCTASSCGSSLARSTLIPDLLELSFDHPAASTNKDPSQTTLVGQATWT